MPRAPERGEGGLGPACGVGGGAAVDMVPNAAERRAVSSPEAVAEARGPNVGGGAVEPEKDHRAGRACSREDVGTGYSAMVALRLCVK